MNILKICKYTSLFLKLAAFEDDLEALPADKKIKDFVLSHTGGVRGKLFNALKKNPNISIQELESLAPDYGRAHHPDDLSAVSGLHPNLSGFLLIELSKARNKNRKKHTEILQNIDKIKNWHDSGITGDIASHGIDKILDMSNKYHELTTAKSESIPALDNLLIGIDEPLLSWLKIKFPEFMKAKKIATYALEFEGDKYRAEFVQLQDWYNTERPLNLPDLNFEEATNLMVRWHGVQALKYKGTEYAPLDLKLIVKGPNDWDDPKNNGHFIIELNNENDLRAEGAKMNHCVGSYWPKVNGGDCKIFSLRDSSNNPHATIEMDHTASIARQIRGFRNARLQGKYDRMVEEWINSRTQIFVDKVAPVLIANIKIISKKHFNDLRSYRKLLSPEDNNIVTMEENSRAAKASEAMTTKSPERLAELATEADYEIRSRVAENKYTLGKNLLDLLEDKEQETVRYSAANNRNMPREGVIKMMDSDDVELRRIIARSSRVREPWIADRVSEDSEVSVRRAAASNDRLPIKNLVKMCDDHDYYVLLRLAHNINLPKEGALILIRPVVYDEVREIVAGHKNMPANKLLELADDKSYDVRQSAMKNPNMPIEGLRKALTKEYNTKGNEPAIEAAKYSLLERGGR